MPCHIVGRLKMLLCLSLPICSASISSAQVGSPCYYMEGLCYGFYAGEMIEETLPSNHIRVYDTVVIPVWMDQTTVENIIESAIDAWVDGTPIVMSTTSSEDATTRIHFLKTQAEVNAALASGVPLYGPAVTHPLVGNQRDIYLNCTNESSWNLGPCDGVLYHLQTILIHEFGHVLGLRHNYDQCTQTIMYFNAESGATDCVEGVMPYDKNAIRCAYPNDPDSEIEGFHVAKGVARWNVVSERFVSGYALEGCKDPNGKGTLISRVGPEPGLREVPLPPHEYPFIRLVEVNQDNNYLPKGVAASEIGYRGSTASAPDPRPLGFDPPRQLRKQHKSANPSGVSQATSGSSDYVIYTSSDLESSVSNTVAQYWSNRGYQVEIVTGLETLPEEDRRNAVKADISTRVATNNAFRFHVVGTWLDREHTTLSDQQIADLDGDGAPDVVFTRWSAEDAAAVGNAYQKMEWYNNYLHLGTQTAAFFTGDIDASNLTSVNSGAYALGLALDLQEHLVSLAPDRNISVLQESAVPDDYARAQLAAARLNVYRPELITLLGTASSRINPAHFFTAYAAGGPAPWSTSLLDPNTIVPIVLAVSCMTSQPPAPSSVVGNVASMFLFDSGTRGSVSWVGSTEGTLQWADYSVAHLFIEELYGNPCRPMAESFMVALQRAHTAYPDESDYKDTIDSFVFNGDPLTPFKTTDGELTVDILGPQQAESEEQNQFHAAVSGGLAPYTYQWYKADNCAGYPIWYPIGTGQSVTTGSRESFCIRLLVSDACKSEETLHEVEIPQEQPPPRMEFSSRTPEQFGLNQNLPNPFNQVTHLSFDLPEPQSVSLIVYDIRGRVVRKLIEGVKEAGSYNLVFDRRGLPSGIYYYQIVTDQYRETRRMVLLK